MQRPCTHSNRLGDILRDKGEHVFLDDKINRRLAIKEDPRGNQWEEAIAKAISKISSEIEGLKLLKKLAEGKEPGPSAVDSVIEAELKRMGTSSESHNYGNILEALRDEEFYIKRAYQVLQLGHGAARYLDMNAPYTAEKQTTRQEGRRVILAVRSEKIINILGEKKPFHGPIACVVSEPNKDNNLLAYSIDLDEKALKLMSHRKAIALTNEKEINLDSNKWCFEGIWLMVDDYYGEIGRSHSRKGTRRVFIPRETSIFKSSSTANTSTFITGNSASLGCSFMETEVSRDRLTVKRTTPNNSAKIYVVSSRIYAPAT